MAADCVTLPHVPCVRSLYQFKEGTLLLDIHTGLSASLFTKLHSFNPSAEETFV